MSLSLFCSNCGEKINYTLKRPNFCPSCGYNFSTASFKSAPSTSKSNEISTSSPKSIVKLDVEIEVQKNETSLASLMKEGSTGFSRGRGASNGEDIVKQLESECSPIRK